MKTQSGDDLGGRQRAMTFCGLTLVNEKLDHLSALSRDGLADLMAQLQYHDHFVGGHADVRWRMDLVAAYLAEDGFEQKLRDWMEAGEKAGYLISISHQAEALIAALEELAEDLIASAGDSWLSGLAQVARGVVRCAVYAEADQRSLSLKEIAEGLTRAELSDPAVFDEIVADADALSNKLISPAITLGYDLDERSRAAVKYAAMQMKKAGLQPLGAMLLAAVAGTPVCTRRNAVELTALALDLLKERQDSAGTALLQYRIANLLDPSLCQLRILEIARTTLSHLGLTCRRPDEQIELMLQIEECRFIACFHKTEDRGQLVAIADVIEGLHKELAGSSDPARAATWERKLKDLRWTLQIARGRHTTRFSKGTNPEPMFTDDIFGSTERAWRRSRRTYARPGRFDKRNVPVSGAYVFLRDPEAEITYFAPSLAAASSAVDQLIGKGRTEEAEALATRALSVRNDCYRYAITLDEAQGYLASGASLPSLLAILRWRRGDIGGALEILANEVGVAFVDMLADPIWVVGPDKRRIAVLRAQASNAETVRDIVERWLELDAAVQEQRGNRMQVKYEFTLERVLALRPEMGVLATLAITKGGAVVFLVLPDGSLDAVDLPDLTLNHARKLLIDMVDSAVTFAKDVDADDPFAAAAFGERLQAQSETYWTQLIGPIEQKLADRHVRPKAPITFVATGMLENLPVHTASHPDGEGGHHYLIENRVIRFAPSFSALRIMQERRERNRSPLREVVGFFAPTINPGKPDLENSLTIEYPELAAISDLKLEAFTGPDARLTKVLETLARLRKQGRRVSLHFSTHASYNPLFPELSGLHLVADGQSTRRVALNILDIVGADPTPALGDVCLAGCYTAMSDIRGGFNEGLGLAEAFLILGATSVLTAHYCILDRETSQMIPDLYRLRLKGTDFAEALHQWVRVRLKAARRGQQMGVGADLVQWAAFRPICG